MDIIERAIREKRNTLSEYESKELLRAYGIPTAREREIREESDLMEAVREIGFPMVIKGSAPHLTHKTERGLVRLGIRSEEEAERAFREIMKEIRGEGGGVLLQEMVVGARELVVGLTRDVQFGPCVMFGLGGIFTEILSDVSFRVAPIQKRDALEMMQEIKAAKILGAVRGMPAADLDRLSDILINVARIGVEEERIKEIDMNPVILAGEKPVVVDALVVLRD